MFEAEQKFRLSDPTAFLKEISRIGLVWRKKVVEIDTYFQHPSRDFVQTDEALRLRRHLTFFASDSSETADDSSASPIGPARVEVESLITLKGPKLDRETKIRKEIELPLSVRQELAPEPFSDVSLAPSILNFDSAASETQSNATSVPNSPQALWKLLDTLPETAICSQWTEMLTILGFRSVRNVCKVRSKAFWTWDGAPVEFSLDAVFPIGMFAELEFLAEKESDIPIARERILTLSDFLHLHEVEPRSYLGLVVEACTETSSKTGSKTGTETGSENSQKTANH